MNVAEQDQVEAAGHDLATRLLGVADATGWASHDDPGPVVAAIADRFVSVAATSCGHLPTPQLVFGLAHQPGHIMCGPCATRAALATHGTPEDHTCDGCGTRSEQLTCGATQVGPLALFWGLCDTCAAPYNEQENSRA